MSFSRSRLRRTLMSMSTRLPLALVAVVGVFIVFVVCYVIRRGIEPVFAVEAAELHLHAALGQLAPLHPAGGAVGLQPDTGVVDGQDAALHGGAVTQIGLDQPALRAAPVAGLGQRP